MSKNKKKKRKSSWLGRFFGRLLLFLLVTLLLAGTVVYAAGALCCYGPSEHAKELFVRSVRETSAIGFLSELYLSEEELAEIYRAAEDSGVQATDPNLVTIVKPGERQALPDPAEPGQTAGDEGSQLIDEDGDGIILVEVKGDAYSGFLMKILDPTRVIMGSVPASFQARGYTVAEMVQTFDAVAGINAGGFYDPDGRGNGSIPDSLVVYEGEIYYASLGTRQGFVGLDAEGILHVAPKISADDIREKNIRYGVCFGPVLISNGVMASEESLKSGLNPRTAIGQCADGSILFLVIDGRQANSLGARLGDLAKIMMDYGAVNACNLDGGSSSLLWYEGDYVNNCASVIGIRPVPTTFLVLKEGFADEG